MPTPRKSSTQSRRDLRTKCGTSQVAVLAGGIDRPYPRGNSDLLARIGDLGVLASEAPPGATPTRWRFMARARLLGALSGATVIPEAGFRSGSLLVATEAHRHSRAVGAVPGPVTSAASVGPHELIKRGRLSCTGLVPQSLEHRCGVFGDLGLSGQLLVADTDRDFS